MDFLVKRRWRRYRDRLIRLLKTFFSRQNDSLISILFPCDHFSIDFWDGYTSLERRLTRQFIHTSFRMSGEMQYLFIGIHYIIHSSVSALATHPRRWRSIQFSIWEYYVFSLWLDDWLQINSPFIRLYFSCITIMIYIFFRNIRLDKLFASSIHSYKAACVVIRQMAQWIP